MNNYRAPQAIGILAGEMRVVEGATIWGGLECLRIATAWRYGTHRDCRYSIHPFCILLIHAVVMYSSSFLWVSNSIGDSHLYCVSPIRFNGWLQITQLAHVNKRVFHKTHARVLAIDEEHVFRVAIRRYGTSSNRELVGSNDSSVGWLSIRVGIRRALRAPRPAIHEGLN